MAQIGTIRLETQNNGTVSVPVFNTGDSGSNVYEFVRVQTAGGTGFIPVVDPADASFPYLRVQSQNQGVVAVHNESTLQFNGTIDSFEDQDLSEYTYEVQNDTFTFTSNDVIDGTYALYSNAGADANLRIRSDSGLQYYPEEGDTFEFYTNDLDGNTNMYMYWGIQDTSQQNSFGIQLHGGAQIVRLFEWSNGSLSIAYTAEPNVPNNTWIRSAIEWRSGGEHRTLVEDADGSTTYVDRVDTLSENYDSGSISLEMSTGSSGGLEGKIDYVNTIENI